MVNKDTQLCISLASSPSNFGTTLHNAAYAAMGLNFVYKSFGISDLAGALIGVRALNIRGCSLSMPFKEAALPLLDDLDETARLIGAVNSIVNHAGRLTGYNTDAVGARKALESIRVDPRDKVLLLGAGGVARAILFVLRQMGFRQVQVSNRDPEKIKRLDSIMPCKVVPWKLRHKAGADLLINATSVGMSPDINQSPMEEGFLCETKAVMDVVVSPMESCLIKLARSMGKDVAPGYLISLEQMIEQFRLYTGEVPPRDVIEQSLKQLLAN
jgi:shikimate dehydrogenase